MSKIILIVVVILAIVAALWIWDNKPWIKAVDEKSGFDLIDKTQKEVEAIGNRAIIFQSVGNTESFSNGTIDPKIPSTIPGEFVYPGSTVQTIQQLGGRGIIVVLATYEPKNKVSDFLLSQLASSGWKKISGSIQEIANFEKASQKAQIEVSVEENITIISLGLTFSKQ